MPTVHTYHGSGEKNRKSQRKHIKYKTKDVHGASHSLRKTGDHIKVQPASGNNKLSWHNYTTVFYTLIKIIFVRKRIT